MIRIGTEAAQDVQAAFDWYEQAEPGLGDTLLDTLDAVYARVQQNPRLFPKTYANFRRAVLPRLPYCVYFSVEPTCVLVVGVLHGKQDLRRLLQRR